MNIAKLALGGAIVAGLLYLAAVFFGLFHAGPAGLIGFLVIGFGLLLFVLVLKDKLGNAEDRHYEENVKD